MMKIFAAIARFLGAAGLLLGLLVPFAYAVPLLPFEIEPNDTPGTANLLNLNEVVKGQTSSGTDQDWFRVTTPGGAVTISAVLTGTAAAGQGWNLTIVDPAGTEVLASAPCVVDSSSSCERTLDTGLVAAGNYFIVVSSCSLEPPFPCVTLTANDYSLIVRSWSGPTCTLTASPGTVTPPATSTLTATCNPAATSYAWSPNAGFPASASTGTVAPTVDTTYSVTGFSGANPGNAATVTVKVTPSCILTASPPSIVAGQASILAAICTPAATSYAWSSNTGFVPTASSGAVSPLANTTYSVIGSNAAGTGNTASATVTVTQPPPVQLPPTCTVTASPATIIGGGSSTLTANCNPAATSYFWTNTSFGTSTGTVTPASTTTYTVTGVNSGGTGNTASVTVLVTPNCTLTASPSTILGGGSSTLTATCSPAATSYAWNGTGFASTAASGSVSPVGTTAYSVTGSNADGTGNSASATVSVTPNCTLTASPITITGGGSSTLTANCNPAANFYAWTNTNFGPSAASGTVSPLTTTSYSVTGSNTAGAGNSASATVSVTPNCTLTASPSTIIGGQSSTLTANCSPAATSYVWTPTTGLVAGPGNTATVTPASTTTYSVVASNAAGPSSSASATVSVTPNCTLTASPSIIIGSGSSTLTATCSPAATSYAWTPTSSLVVGLGNTATVTPTSTTTYSVIGSNAAGPGNTASLTVPVTPRCTLTASPSAVPAGGSSILTATCTPAATSYAWTNTGFGPTVNIGIVSPTVSTTYSVIGSNADGPGNTASVTVSVTTCTYSLSPTSQFAPLSISNGSVNVISTLITVVGATSFSQSNASACDWTAVSNAFWITMPFSTSGSGNGTVFFSVAANTNGGPRTGTLTIGGQTFTVTQAGMAVPNCTLAASASTISLDASVILTATCSPAATSYDWAPAAGLVAGPGNTAVVTPTAVGVYQYSVTGSNAGGAGNIASTLVTVTAATFISRSDCLFNWAERTYPELFAPAGAKSITLPPYYYRYYSQTNAYLATSSADSHVYYFGPLSNNSILDVGALSGWLATAGCQ